MIKIIFFGTPEFAVPSLRRFAGRDDIILQAVVTQPDAPKGRSLRITPSPVALVAAELGLPVLKIDKFTDASQVNQLRQYNVDCYVVVAYGAMLPLSLLALPHRGALNLHPSLLPRYRGPSPIPSAILNGDAETGVSIMVLDAEMDHGPICTQKKVALLPTDTAPALSDRLAQIGAGVFVETLIDYVRGTIHPFPQDDARATYTKQLTKEDGRIDWTKTSDTIARQVRAYTPWPGSWTMLDYGKKPVILKIMNAVSYRGVTAMLPELMPLTGKLIQLRKNRYAFVCGNGTLLEVTVVQPTDRRIMPIDSFIRGHPWIVTTI
ncbi:MAG: methionyl-tRNA formyltransferase [Patescibacteria group bacterium]